MESIDVEEKKKMFELMKDRELGGNMDWMYRGDKTDAEEFLLGKSIDKLVSEATSNEGSGSIFSERVKANVALDMAAKMREDPLFAIKKKEEEAKRHLLENPVKMKQLQKLVEQQQKMKLKASKKKEKKDKKKKKKKKKGKGGDSSSSSDDSSDSEDDLVNQYLTILTQKKKGDSGSPDKKASNDHRGRMDRDDRHENRNQHQPNRKDWIDRNSGPRRDFGRPHEQRSHDERQERDHRSHDSRDRDHRSHDSRDRDHRSHDSRHDRMQDSRHERMQDSRQERDLRRGNEKDHKNSRDKRDNSTRSASPPKSSKNRKNGGDRRDGRRKSPSPPQLKRPRESSSESSEREQKHQPRRQDSSDEGETSKRVYGLIKSVRHNMSAPDPPQPAKQEKAKRSRKSSSSSSSSSRSRSPKRLSDKERKRHSEKKKSSKRKSSSGSRSRSPVRKRDTTPEKRHRSRSRSPKPKKSKSPPKRPLTADEKAKRLQEMMEDAKWRDEQRKQNVQRYRKEADKEGDRLKTYQGEAQFLSSMMSQHASNSTVEDRLKRNKYNIQRTRAALDKNFTQH